MNYSKVIKELRENNNLTQLELAKALEINRVQYNQYENDYNTIPIKHLNNLCNYFNVSIDYIFGLSSSDKYNKIIKVIDSKKAGLRLKGFRKENKITQKKLAEFLNTTQGVIANYERGRTIISTSFLYTICKKYHISADYLLGKTDEPKYFH